MHAWGLSIARAFRVGVWTNIPSADLDCEIRAPCDAFTYEAAKADFPT